MERTELGHSSNSEPGGRYLSGSAVKAQAGIARLRRVSRHAEAGLKEAVAGRE